MAAPSAFPVLVTNPAAYPQQLQCLAKPCKDLSHNQDLQSLLLSGHITVSFTWCGCCVVSVAGGWVGRYRLARLGKVLWLLVPDS